MKCPTCQGAGVLAKPEVGAIKCIVAELNRVAGTNYLAKTMQTRKVITARLNDGFTATDFASVIKTKCEQWLRDPTMKKFIRPTTLFGPKFEGYLNESTVAPKQKVKFVY